MWLLCERVPEEDQQINFMLGYLRPNLLVASQGSALELVNLNTQLLFQYLAGGSRCKQFMLNQQRGIVSCPFQEIMFFIIVRHKGDSFFVFHNIYYTTSFWYPDTKVHFMVFMLYADR